MFDIGYDVVLSETSQGGRYIMFCCCLLKCGKQQSIVEFSSGNLVVFCYMFLVYKDCGCDFV